MQIVVREEPQLFLSSSITNSFLGISLDDPKGWEHSLAQLSGKSFPRHQLSRVLYDYNSEIGNDGVAEGNIKKILDPSSVCVITGQQLGVCGGPIYTLLKAATALLIAKEKGAVPIFWLATEDHDIDEINHTFFLDSIGNLKKLLLSLPKEGTAVESLPFTKKNQELLRSFFGEGFSFEGSSYTSVMLKFLVEYFRGTGLVFVEPKLFRTLAIPFFEKEIVEAEAIDRCLKNTTKRLLDEGVEPQMVFRNGTQLFMQMPSGRREKIIREEDGTFFIGKEKMTEDVLLGVLRKAPECFSTNGAARTVLQSTLFPTAAYVAGPGEIAYYHQLRDYHHFHGIEMPWVVPRLSGTFISKEAQRLLELCGKQPWEPISSDWKEVIPGMDPGFEALQREWQDLALSYCGEDLTEQSIGTIVKWSVKKLERKITRKKLREKGIPAYALHYLNNMLRPKGKLQERVLNWWEFQGKTEEHLLGSILEQVKWNTRGHHYFYL